VAERAENWVGGSGAISAAENDGAGAEQWVEERVQSGADCGSHRNRFERLSQFFF